MEFIYYNNWLTTWKTRRPELKGKWGSSVPPFLPMQKPWLFHFKFRELKFHIPPAFNNFLILAILLGGYFYLKKLKLSYLIIMGWEKRVKLYVDVISGEQKDFLNRCIGCLTKEIPFNSKHNPVEAWNAAAWPISNKWGGFPLFVWVSILSYIVCLLEQSKLHRNILTYFF